MGFKLSNPVTNPIPTAPGQQTMAVARQTFNVLLKWADYAFDTEMAWKVIEEMKLSNQEIKELHGFNMKLMLGTIRTDIGMLCEPTYIGLRMKPRPRPSRLHSGELLAPGDLHVMQSSTASDVLYFVAKTGYMNKFRVINELNLKFDDFMKLGGLSGRVIVHDFARRPGLPQTDADAKQLEEEYKEICCWGRPCVHHADKTVTTDRRTSPVSSVASQLGAPLGSARRASIASLSGRAPTTDSTGKHKLVCMSVNTPVSA